MEPPTPSRRRFLAGGVAALAGVVAACSDSGTGTGTGTDDGAADSTTTAPPRESPATTVATPEAADPAEADPPLGPDDFAALATCALVPAMGAGPFPNPEELVRRDVTEGRAGRPLRLGLRVVDAECTPVPGASVDVWHADPSGDYSAYEDGGSGKDEAAGTSFLRGTQVTDGDGIVEFRTLYPGWYGGRAIHVHLTARVGDRELLTTQLSFPEDVTAAVLATGEYAEFGPADTSNAEDGLFSRVDVGDTMLSLTGDAAAEGSPLLGLINLGLPST
ncbi:MAG: intradiol ring-cleavage dioxygenase [Actinomycetota bacterium]